MPSTEARNAADHVLIVAPIGRDAALMCAALGAAGITARAVADAEALIVTLAALAPHAPGAVIIAEEALNPAVLPGLVGILLQQPVWCELPIILLAFAERSDRQRVGLIEQLGPAGSVTLVDRPVRTATLVNTVRVTLRSRARQYDARDQLLRHEALADELRIKAAELERSNADLEQFAYVASHDLQEPLRMISNYLELLRRRYDAAFDDKALSFFQHAIDGATRMSDMIRSILQYSRLGSRVPLGDIAVADAVGDALENLQPKIDATKATVVVGELPRAHSDRSLLAQVLQNLISNGIKFSRGAPVVHVSAEQVDGVPVIRVADQGIGFPTEAGERAFQLFQRFHSDRTIPGTGIGLATCRKIVELHGGRIWVTSKPGEGSVFSFTLAAPKAA